MKRPPILACVLVLLLVALSSAQAGKLRRLIYDGYPGVLVTNLYDVNPTGASQFPDIPNTIDFMPPAPALPPYTAESVAFTAGTENYGSMARGYLTAPETGAYTFWIYGDDECVLLLNSDSSDPRNPAKKSLIASVPGYSGVRQWDKFPEQKSAPVQLVAGVTYYIEVLHKEGTGGDSVGLGWQLPSGTLEQPMAAWHLQPEQDARWGELETELVIGPIRPRTVGDPTLYDGMEVVAYVNINLPQPVTYQWAKAPAGGTTFTPINGATASYIKFRVNSADEGTQYQVVVTAGGQTYTAGPGAISIIADRPTLVSATLAPSNPTVINVLFSEDVSPATAGNLANYSLPGATVQSATLQNDGRTVQVKTSLLTPDRVWTLTVQNIEDLATPGNLLDPNPSTASFSIAEGSISFQIYYGAAGGDLAGLRTWMTTATYTNNAYSEVRYVTTTSQGWPLAPLRDNYGGQLIGYITAPETGPYRFGIASDDHSILFVGTNDLRSSKREVARCTGSTGQWNMGQFTTNQVSPDGFITLEAGKRYFIEAVYRDGTGGEGVTVVWKKPSDIMFDTANVSTAANIQPYLIPAQYLSPYTAYGNVVIKTNPPATLSAAESSTPTLTLAVDGTRPYGFQWYKNNEPVPGATAAAYRLPPLRLADSGAVFYAIVTNAFSSATSTTTTLTVTNDVSKPTVASVGSLLKQTVDVTFSEPVTAATAGDRANYTLTTAAGTPVTIAAATPDPAAPTKVTLQTAALPDTETMTLVIANVADQSTAGLVMVTSTNTFRSHNFDATERINNSQSWSITAQGDRVLLTGGGTDIWGTSDQLVYVYKAVNGDFDYKVQGISLPAVNQWCKMGIMARQTTAANSRNGATFFTPASPGQNTYSPQVRDLTAGASTSSADVGSPLNLGMQGTVAQRPTVVYPSWLRLQRIGNSLYYYYGTTGTNWTFWTYYDSAQSAEGALPSNLLLGLALTSHDTTRTVDGVMAGFAKVDDGALRFALNPTNTTAVEGGTAVFTAAAAGNMPYFYQWLKNTQPVQDATNATLTLTRVSFADNGAQITCRVTNPQGENVTSATAILTVTQDGTAPTFRFYLMPKINITVNGTKILFSEPVTRATAENLANYRITDSSGNPLAITSAVLEADERTVAFLTADQTPGTTYKIVGNNVTDQACCPPNAIAPNTTDYFFYAGSSGRYAQRADGYIIMEAENAQRNVMAGDGDTFQLRTAAANFSGLGYMLVPNGAGTGGTTLAGGIGQGTGAALEFDILFNRTGTHTLWIRGWNENTAAAGNDDSLFAGLDANFIDLGPAASDVNYSQLTGWPASGWDWRSDRATGTDPLVFTNATTGLHTLLIWQREDGTLVDKVLIEPGFRTTAGNTTEPAPATSNGGRGDPETWDFIVAPPGGPTIAITSPVNNQPFAAGANIPIVASVSGPSQIALVEFFRGTNLVGTATASPYSTTTLNVPEGIYSLTARVTDVLGYQATSAAVRIIVDSTKPVAYAVGSLGGNAIGVYFSDLEGLDPVSATTLANYTVNNGAVTLTSATLEIDNKAVILVPSTPISGNFTVNVQNVADRGFGPNIMDPVTLSSSVITWILNRDVGTVNTNNPALFTDPIMPGLAQAIGTDGYYARAGGHDIWDAADGMHFVHTQLTGNFDVSTRVQSILQADAWSKAGLMIRTDLDGNSRNFYIAATPTNGQNLITMQWRETKGAATASIADAQRPRPSPLPNAWLRMTRVAEVLTFQWGTNGTTWTTLYTTNMATGGNIFAPTVYVGLATTSHNNGTNAANVTAAYYRDIKGFGAPPAPTSPTLTARIVGSNIEVSWTSSSSAFALQSTLGLPANWQPVNLPITVNGDQRTVSVPIIADIQYFRVVAP
jgi:hypothetical protein